MRSVRRVTRVRRLVSTEIASETDYTPTRESAAVFAASGKSAEFGFNCAVHVSETRLPLSFTALRRRSRRRRDKGTQCKDTGLPQ